eukprot:12967871-Alexandrium_andersonii.AAC.1
MTSQNPSDVVYSGGPSTNSASELRGTPIGDRSRLRTAEGGIMVENQATGPMISASDGLGTDELAVRVRNPTSEQCDEAPMNL